MNSHYTIISAAIRPEIQEKITLGLLFVSANKVLFNFSKNKVLAIKTLLDNQNLYKYLTDTIKQIENSVYLENTKNATLLHNEALPIKYSIGYLSYMNRYSNNLIHFSAPIQNDLEIKEEELFNLLFNEYIDNTIAPIQKKTKSIVSVKEEFYPQIKSYYNTNKTITKQDIPKLPMPVEIDIIGKNEIPVFAQIIDFERPIYNINHDALILSTLMNVYDSKAKSFIVGNEPDKTVFPKSHMAWNDLREWNQVTFLPVDEIDGIKKYAEDHGVIPLF
jgi:hypothetical protein